MVLPLFCVEHEHRRHRRHHDDDDEPDVDVDTDDDSDNDEDEEDAFVEMSLDPRRFERRVARDFRHKIRRFIRDTPAANALLDGHETSDTLIDFALDLTLDDFNSTPPLIGQFQLAFHPSQSLVMLGAIIWILKSAGLQQSRNQLDYASGGITVATSNKTPLYQSWINIMMQEYEAKKLNLKKAINAEQAYGGVNSEYVQINFGGNLVFFGLDSVNMVRNGIFI